MIALSIRQPWAWLILHGHKDVENRSWDTPFRGRCLVHAGKVMTKEQYQAGLQALEIAGLSHVKLPAFDALPRGGIVGSVEIFDCVAESDSPWYTGEKAFLLREPRPLPFVQYRGLLGFFNVPASALQAPATA